MGKVLSCPHVIGKKEGYWYHLISSELNICKECEKKLRKQVFEQDKMEKEIKTYKELKHVRKNKKD